MRAGFISCVTHVDRRRSGARKTGREARGRKRKIIVICHLEADVEAAAEGEWRRSERTRQIDLRAEGAGERAAATVVPGESGRYRDRARRQTRRAGVGLA